MIYPEFRARLLAAVAADARRRARLAKSGALFRGYHPEMRAIHDKNAAMLGDFIARHGWPTEAFVDKDGAEAAWLIVQHAIACPDFQRSCLAKLAASDAPRWQVAMLDDRIRVFEGHRQLYGTAFDWDEQGLMSPLPIEQPARVDARREAAGLPDLAETIARHRAEAEPPPADLAVRDAAYRRWLVDVGWRVAEDEAID